MLFRKRPKRIGYDPDKVKPVLRRSICTGETTAGFRELSGERKYREIMLIRTEKDLREFMSQYGIDQVPDTEY